jgi:DNA-binding transcriptional MocR family regulator
VDRSGDPFALAHLIGHRLTGRSGGLYRQLADEIAALIGSSELPVGARLPAERRLAESLAISRSTVVAAYDELRSRGLVESRLGSGTTVARGAGRGRSRADKRIPTGYGESLFHRITVGPGEVISLTYAVDPGLPELSSELIDLASTELPASTCSARPAVEWSAYRWTMPASGRICSRRRSRSTSRRCCS